MLSLAAWCKVQEWQAEISRGALFVKVRAGSLLVIAGRQMTARFKALDRLYPIQDTLSHNGEAE